MNRQGIPAERELQERNRIATSKKSSKRANELLKVDLLQPKHKKSPVSFRDSNRNHPELKQRTGSVGWSQEADRSI